MSKVFVQENFFPKDIYNLVVNEMVSVEYAPAEKELREAHDGNYWNKHNFPNDSNLQKKIAELIKEHFNFNKNLEFIECAYTMVGATDQPRPHTDESTGATHNILIHMHGEEARNNGTGFYHFNDKNNLELGHLVGFRRNRAVFWTSDVWHSPLQWAAVNGSQGFFRYAITCFIKAS